MRRKNMKKTAALFLLSVGINCMTVQDIVPVYEFDIDVQNVGALSNQLCMDLLRGYQFRGRWRIVCGTNQEPLLRV